MQLACKPIIMDEEIQGRIILEILKKEINSGFTLPCSASGVTDGLEKIRKSKPDLVLPNIQLQSSTGFELLQQCKGITIDVIIITAYTLLHLRLLAFAQWNSYMPWYCPDIFFTGIFCNDIIQWRKEKIK